MIADDLHHLDRTSELTKVLFCHCVGYKLCDKSNINIQELKANEKFYEISKFKIQFICVGVGFAIQTPRIVLL